MPSDGLSGAGAFVVTWSGLKTVGVTCPPAHPTATCYTVTASTGLPIIGRVVLTRGVAIGDGPGVAPSGCVTAATDGTLTSPTGVFTFHADGLLCGRQSAYTITSSKGTGSMGGYQIRAEIFDDASNENWSGAITPRSGS
jgi:hypothetical protein